MKQPTFLEGVAVALAASFFGSASYAALTWSFPSAGALRLTLAGIGLGYVIYLLSRGRERVGRIAALTVWALAAGTIWLIQPSLPLYVLVHLSLIWLIRALYFHAGVFCALADLGLTGLGLAAAIWAATESGSVFLSIWCFFLVQALFVAIPTRLSRGSGASQPGDDDPDRFQRAHRTAEAAVRKLTSAH
jgi:hypothetical protein